MVVEWFSFEKTSFYYTGQTLNATETLSRYSSVAIPQNLIIRTNWQLDSPWG